MGVLWALFIFVAVLTLPFLVLVFIDALRRRRMSAKDRMLQDLRQMQMERRMADSEPMYLAPTEDTTPGVLSMGPPSSSTPMSVSNGRRQQG